MRCVGASAARKWRAARSALARALERAAIRHGVEVLTGAKVVQVVVKNDRAVGAILA